MAEYFIFKTSTNRRPITGGDIHEDGDSNPPLRGAKWTLSPFGPKFIGSKITCTERTNKQGTECVLSWNFGEKKLSKGTL